MKYVIGCLIPALLQCLLVYFIVLANTGNGSFVGLGAFIIGIFAIPITAVLNAVMLYVRAEVPRRKVLFHCYILALIVPVLVVINLIVL
jgi:hypothetical protein